MQVCKAGGWSQALADAGDNGERLQILVNILNDGRFVLVWDNFENNLDPSKRRFLSTDMECFYKELLAGLVGTSCVIITSRHLPADISLPDTFAVLNLGEFSQTSYVKFLVRDDRVRRLYLAKKLSRSLLLDLRRRFGSAPKFVQQMRGLLPSLDAETLAAELKKFARTRGASPPHGSSKLWDKHDGVLRRPEHRPDLWRSPGGVPHDAELPRRFRWTGHSRGHRENCGSSVEQVTVEIPRWCASALVHAEPEAIDKMWSVYGTLRAWLMEPTRLPADKCEAAHGRQRQFLLGVAKGSVTTSATASSSWVKLSASSSRAVTILR